MFKHIHKERLNTSQSHGFWSAQHRCEFLSICSAQKRKLSLAQTKSFTWPGWNPQPYWSAPLRPLATSLSLYNDRLREKLTGFTSVYLMFMWQFTTYLKIPDAFHICQLIHCLFSMKEESHIRKTEIRARQRAQSLKNFLHKLGTRYQNTHQKLGTVEFTGNHGTTEVGIWRSLG